MKGLIGDIWITVSELVLFSSLTLLYIISKQLFYCAGVKCHEKNHLFGDLEYICVCVLTPISFINWVT